QDSLNVVACGNLLEDVLTIIENKSKVRNSQSKPIASPVKACDINFSSEIAKFTQAVNQQTSACLAIGGNTFPEFRDNIQSYVSAAAVNYNQGNLATMVDTRTMAEMLRAPTEGYAEAIVVPPILAEQFELKHRAARRWLEKEPPRSITTWDDLVSKFIYEFFPPHELRVSVMKSQIFNNGSMSLFMRLRIDIKISFVHVLLHGSSLTNKLTKERRNGHLKSTSGGAQFLREKLVSWSSKKQDCTALSTAEAEYVSLSTCCAQEHVKKGTIELYFVKVYYQLADIFTKALLTDRFNYLVRRLDMRSLSPKELERLAKSLQSQKDLPRSTTLVRVEVLGSDDGVTTSLQLSRNSRPSMLDHQDKYMMKAQIVSKAFKISSMRVVTQDHMRANDLSKKFPRTRLQVSRKSHLNDHPLGGDLDNTKTRRPQPRSNTKNDRVPSASKSSRSNNKDVKVEEHHRNLLLFKNIKHISSACNNSKIDSQDVISKVVCAMCKKCLLSVNHDVCLNNCVNGKKSRGRKHMANVSKNETQQKNQPEIKKPQK
nr:hypothetical protein [Tanacetum cinerariifolium]